MRSGSSLSKAQSRTTVPGSPSSDSWGLGWITETYADIPYEPVDPFKPSLAYSIRHIIPESHATSTVDDPIIGGFLSPCARSASRSTSTTTHSPSSNACTSSPNPAPTNPRLLKFSSKATRPARRQSSHPESVEMQEVEAGHSDYRHDHSEHNHQYTEGPYPRPLPLAHLHSPRGHPQNIIRSENPEHPEHFERIHDQFCSQKTPTSSVFSDFVGLYGRPSESPTICPSPMSPLPTVPESQSQPTLPVIKDYHHTNLNSPTTPRGFVRQEHYYDQDGATVPITSNYFHTTPLINSPPRFRTRRTITPQNIVSPRSIIAHSQDHLQSAGPDVDTPRVRTSFATRTYILAFLLDTLPRQIYLYLLLCIPYMYFSRVANIFEEAEMSLPKIKQGIINATRKEKESAADICRIWNYVPPTTPSIAYFNLQRTWELFIESLIREWKTLNIISVLLLSAIIAILQIGAASNDPFTHYFALLSLICALMSLVYGCIYIIRFGSMRKTFKAAMWAAEAQRSTTCLLWNVWVFLAMPAAWLAWSMITFIICIMSLLWRTGTVKDADSMSMTVSQARFPRIGITVVLFIGVIYFVFIMKTLRRYGNVMDRAWHKVVASWILSHRGTSGKSSLTSSPGKFSTGP